MWGRGGGDVNTSYTDFVQLTRLNYIWSWLAYKELAGSNSKHTYITRIPRSGVASVVGRQN